MVVFNSDFRPFEDHSHCLYRYISVNIIVIYVITTIWLCLEMHAVTKMADLTKFRQTERMFMELAILANFSQILKAKSGYWIWRFGECSPFSLLHAFLDIPLSIIIAAFFSSVSPLYLYCQHLKTLTPISDQDKISPYINNIYQADKWGEYR